MKFYVASSTANLEEAEHAIEELEFLGHEITYDWTKQVREVGPADEGLDANLRSSIEKADRNGVNLAQVVVVLGHPLCCGTLIEMGMALAWCKPVWVVGNLPRDTVFLASPYVERLANLRALTTKVAELGTS